VIAYIKGVVLHNQLDTIDRRLLLLQSSGQTDTIKLKLIQRQPPDD